MTAPSKRRNMDIMKLMMSNYEVEMNDDEGTEFYVDFDGPRETAYEGGKWKVHVTLPPQYPFRSPSVGFKNRIFHPNVDFRSGTICLDVINQTWSPMFDLVNIFDVFLPQLLSYPNPADPLNNDAASLLMQDSEKYNSKVKEFIKLYASSNCLQDEKEEEQEILQKANTSDQKITTPSKPENDETMEVSSSLKSITTTISSASWNEDSEDQQLLHQSEESDEADSLSMELEQTFDLEI